MHLQLDDYRRRCRPGRTIQGISAVLLPYRSNGQIDESGFRTHLRRTLKAGLRAAVNMDTGYVDLLTAEEKQRVLKWIREIAANVGTFIAFELGNMFTPHGRMFSERVLAALMELPACRGLKHSSLDRSTEMARLELRDRLRPDF